MYAYLVVASHVFVIWTSEHCYCLSSKVNVVVILLRAWALDIHTSLCLDLCFVLQEGFQQGFLVFCSSSTRVLVPALLSQCFYSIQKAILCRTRQTTYS